MLQQESDSWFAVGYGYDYLLRMQGARPGNRKEALAYPWQGWLLAFMNWGEKPIVVPLQAGSLQCGAPVLSRDAGPVVRQLQGGRRRASIGRASASVAHGNARRTGWTALRLVPTVVAFAYALAACGGDAIHGYVAVVTNGTAHDIRVRPSGFVQGSNRGSLDYLVPAHEERRLPFVTLDLKPSGGASGPVSDTVTVRDEDCQILGSVAVEGGTVQVRVEPDTSIQASTLSPDILAPGRMADGAPACGG